LIISKQKKDIGGIVVFDNEFFMKNGRVVVLVGFERFLRQ
jgi:hypothetical protein